MERRCRIPVRLAEFVPLFGVGLRHLVVEGGLDLTMPAEPVKQVRLKYDSDDAVILDQLSRQFGAKAPRVIVAALECAARCRLNPESQARRAAVA